MSGDAFPGWPVASIPESQGLAHYEQLARIVIIRRAELGPNQQELASRMATSHAAISRIERGQHPTSARTLRRLTAALEEPIRDIGAS